MKSQGDFKNYLAGAALAFGIVLITSQILQWIYSSLSFSVQESIYGLIVNIYLASHLAGGFLGGYLVARAKGTDYIQTGTVTGVLAYIFEFIYTIVFEGARPEIYAIISLLIGSIAGAMFLRARMERRRMSEGNRGSSPSVNPVKYT